MNALADLPNQTASSTTSTYNLYEDQVTIAGEVYTDALFKTHTDSQATNKRVYGFLVIPIENFAASGTSNDYFIPNFIPKTLWSYGDVGHDYCLGMASNSASDCNTYENYYDFSSIALSEAVNAGTKRIDTSRFTGGSANDFPEGQSMWWQVLDTSGTFNKGVGLWAQISIKDGYIEAESKGRLKGCEFHFDLVSVTATENALMAACLAEGTTFLKNCAREPEVSDLANCLNDCGAKISGIGSDQLVIEGVKELNGTSFSIMPDRIETATYLVATTMTGGEITIKNCQPNSLGAVITKLEEAGANIICSENEINLKMKEDLPKSTSLSTAPFPSFPTDMQAQFIALNSISNGSATVTETVFELSLIHI